MALSDLEASRCTLIEYDSEASEVFLGNVLKLPAVSWEGWIGVINGIKLKDVALLGAAAWMLHEFLFRKPRKRISGSAHSRQLTETE
jgi:hypothetical protein